MLKPITILCLVVLMFIMNILPAQIQQLQKSSASLGANINVLEESFTVFESKSAPILISDLNMELKDSEFLISYRLTPLEEGQYYLIKIDFQLNNESFYIHPGFIRGNLGKIDQLEKNQELTIIWTDLLEQYLNLEGKISVILHAELWGKPSLPYNIDCDSPPEFAFKQKLPHYISGLVGAGLLGSGLILLNEADNIYENEYKTSLTQADAEPLYQEANQTRHTALILVYSGTGILLGDIIWYSIRQVRYKNRKETFDTYCKDKKLSLRPVLINPNGQDKDTRFGINMTLRF